MMTLQEVFDGIFDGIKEWWVGAMAWFDDGANHLGNFEVMQLTLGQAAFTVFVIGVVMYSVISMIEMISARQ
jgi:hypothetical protein